MAKPKKVRQYTQKLGAGWKKAGELVSPDASGHEAEINHRRELRMSRKANR